MQSCLKQSCWISYISYDTYVDLYDIEKLDKNKAKCSAERISDVY